MSEQVAAVKRAGKPNTLLILVILTLASMMLWQAPIFNWILGPVGIFVTTLHEMSHALTCIATGGTVSGLTIVPDSSGHGGITLCKGGNPFVYVQAGYLGTAFWGCLFIILGRFRGMAKPVLAFMGGLIVVATVVFMPGTAFNGGNLLQSLGSMVWALVIGAGLIWCGFKLPPTAAQWLLLFLAVQTALNAVTDTANLMRLAYGGDAVQNDDTIMESFTHVPAWIWSTVWAGTSICMLASTLWLSYGSPFNGKEKKA